MAFPLQDLQLFAQLLNIQTYNLITFYCFYESLIDYGIGFAFVDAGPEGT